ncbi:MAG: DUF4339 domain-containing protein [Oscillospiraceae bacterium]|nr:DUF4339 domain-containing protein [Oscillospiraceae bacterium]
MFKFGKNAGSVPVDIDPNAAPSEDKDGEERRCPRCGAVVPAGAEDCDKCGAIFAQTEKADLSDPRRCWYYAYRSRYKGPYTAAKMAELMRDTTILENTMVWKDGDKYARAAADSAFSEIFLEDIVAPPAKLVKDNYFVAFAALPAILCAVLSVFLKASVPSYIILAAVYVVLSAVFLRLDKKELENKNIKLDDYVWLGIILAPIYMVPRLGKTSKRYAYILLWAVLIVIFFFR